MKSLLYLYLLSFLILVLSSCSPTKENQSSLPDKETNSLVTLPKSLTSIPSEQFDPLLGMIGDASLIGLSEGTHGMREPLDFRNELIKFLVTKKRIDVIAIESGILESRLVHDYINGKQGNLDSVFVHGIMPGFNELEQNKALIEWLRNYNSDPSNSHKVSFYGFDIPGIPTNPWNEEISIPLVQTLAYLKEVDTIAWRKYTKQLTPFLPYFHINPTGEYTTKEYRDLSHIQQLEITVIVQSLLSQFLLKKADYIEKSSEEDFDWGYRAAVNAEWMDKFLRDMMLDPDYSYNEREQAMVDNLDWILQREQNGNVLLFAHLAHLSKDLSIIDATGKDQRPLHLFGEYLNEKFRDNYVVIANFFETLHYPEETATVSATDLESKFKRADCENYYMRLDTSDTTFHKVWTYGIRWDSTYYQMNPIKAIDIVLWTRSQHYIE